MPDVSIFSLAGQSINVKDSTARSTATAAQNTASNALSTAQAAQSAANTLESRVDEIANLSRVTVSYNAQNETIAIATGDHKG